MDQIFSTVEEAIQEIQRGNLLIVLDDKQREDEGDFIMAAEKATPDAVNFVLKHGRGLLCQAITSRRAEELELNPMVEENSSHHRTAFTVSVDAKGITSTGISAFDRAATIRKLIDPLAKPEDFLRPGHIFPIIARERGVFERQGHTEAAVDLARLSGLRDSAILCEILDDDGATARLPRLIELSKRWNLRILRILDLLEYLRNAESLSPLL